MENREDYLTNTTVFEFLEATQAKKTSLREKKRHINSELQPRDIDIYIYICKDTVILNSVINNFLDNFL